MHKLVVFLAFLLAVISGTAASGPPCWATVLESGWQWCASSTTPKIIPVGTGDCQIGKNISAGQSAMATYKGLTQEGLPSVYVTPVCCEMGEPPAYPVFCISSESENTPANPPYVYQVVLQPGN